MQTLLNIWNFIRKYSVLIIGGLLAALAAVAFGRKNTVAKPPTNDADHNGQDDQRQIEAILAYRNASKNNREALEHMVQAHNEVVAERNLMTQALKLEEARKNAMAESYAEAENGRRYEQQTRIIETTIYKALLVIIGISAL